ncbi:hypothetical protein NKR17_20835 [Priestia flexa]|uniref:Uncharacterized protein n=1 Tax=Priestia flexa TaxID=86664 RepID=A0ABU4JA88_9BACI|nr:hypothetical protein [Priestia flexa]MCP1191471.1 hypothetical protein [Priestia flexa]MDW8517920.1 hypothetical protein [Priestia flexa]QCS51225.1 hypothetical protein FED53_00505 [Priestia flexa]
MNIVDSKVINTKYGLEMYLDLVKTIEVKELHSPTDIGPFYEIVLGVEYFLLRDRKYYDSERNYFRLRMSDDFNSITLKETDTESLFAVKTEHERDSTKLLIGQWLIKTNAFKEVICQLIQQKKIQNVQNEGDIQKALGTITFLEKLLELKIEDILTADVEERDN